VLFVCEDNRWAATTPTRPLTAGEGATARAQAYGIPAIAVDGNDVEAVDRMAAELVRKVRLGRPALLHAITYRIKGHVSVDPGAYRDADEVARAKQADPLARARALLASLGEDAAAQAIDAEVRREIAQALATAEAAPWPAPEAAFEDVVSTGAGQWR
jgi:pyruvate dehydrogenase E1 component alpha subunit